MTFWELCKRIREALGLWWPLGPPDSDTRAGLGSGNSVTTECLSSRTRTDGDGAGGARGWTGHQCLSTGKAGGLRKGAQRPERREQPPTQLSCQCPEPGEAATRSSAVTARTLGGLRRSKAPAAQGRRAQTRAAQPQARCGPGAPPRDTQTAASHPQGQAGHGGGRPLRPASWPPHSLRLGLGGLPAQPTHLLGGSWPPPGWTRTQPAAAAPVKGQARSPEGQGGADEQLARTRHHRTPGATAAAREPPAAP